jgi:spectinomycin phosphotransferase
MLEPPDIPVDRIAACLRAAYDVRAADIAFLPLGADQNTAVYRAIVRDGTPYFVKLRRGAFDETTVALPRFLHEQGIAPIIPPLVTGEGRLSAELAPFTVIVYPFVEGRSGFDVVLSER